MNGIARSGVFQFTAIFLRLSEIAWRKAFLVEDNKVRQHSKNRGLVAQTIQYHNTYDAIVSINPTSRYE